MISAKEELTCPLCGEHNKCGANNSSPCWCMDEKVPHALIQRVPKKLKGQACICQHCISKFKFELANPIS